MKAKKLISLFLIFALVFAAAACSKPDTSTGGSAGSGTVTPAVPDPAPSAPDDAVTETDEVPAEPGLSDIIPPETVTLDVFTGLANFTGEQTGWFAKLLLDRFNVKLNIIKFDEGMYQTRMASGNLGDIVVWGSDSDEYLGAVQSGMLMDWEEDNILADYGPYMNANMQKAFEKNRNLSGGTVYGFGFDVAPSATEHQNFMYYPDIRWDLYEKLGHPKVSTLEDYIPVLEQMVALEPASDTGQKTYGASLFKDWDGDMVMFVKSTAALYGWDEFGIGLYDANTQNWQDCLSDGGLYLRSLKFYNQLYQKGLLHPDSMTQTSEDQAQHYQTGAAFFVIFNWMGSGNYNTDAHLEAGKAMMPLAADDFKNITYGLNVFGGNRIWSIGASTPYPELCMAIINWLSTPEGKMLSLFGPQGILWDYDENKAPYFTELGEKTQRDKTTEINVDGYNGTFQDGENKINNTTWANDSVNPDSDGSTYNRDSWGSWIVKNNSWDIKTKWMDFTESFSPEDYLKSNGHISVVIGSTYSAPQKSDEFSVVWKQVTDTIKNGSWAAIYATSDDEFDTIVADMVTRANEFGYAECVDFQLNEAAVRKQLENEAK